MEVTNRVKGLDLIGRVPEELWTKVRDVVKEVVIFVVEPEELSMEVHDIVQEAVINTISPRKRNAKSQNGCLRWPYK